MNAIIIFDTRFGNTEQIARAIAAALPPAFTTRVEKVDQVGELQSEPIDLLIVGGPTHMQRMTTELKAVLDAIPRRSLKGVKAAAFDTRYHVAAWLAGSAAKRIAHSLQKAGAQLVVPPESFFIARDIPPEGEKRRHEMEHPEPGELERAAAWARQVAEAVSPA